MTNTSASYELTAEEASEARGLVELFGPPDGDIADGEGPDRVVAHYFICDDVDQFVYFVTIGLASRAPRDGGERYELGLEISGTYATIEIHEIGHRLLVAARRIAPSSVAPEQLVSIEELQHLFPGRPQAYVADFAYRVPEYLPMGHDEMKARLLFLRPVFDEELRWIRTMSQTQVGVTFLRADVDLNDRERAPLVVPVELSVL